MDDLAALVSGPGLVQLDLEAGDWQAVLEAGAERLESGGYVTEGYGAAVIAREREFPTGLQTVGAGVALPHADPRHVRRAAIAVLILRKPVRFAVMGDPTEQVDVSVVFLLALPDAPSQLRALRLLAELVSDSRRLARIAGAHTAQDIMAALGREPEMV
jgi:PTS system galactitol-specific IIA component